MSIDFTVWASKKIELASVLPQAESWSEDWEYEGEGWLVGVEEGENPFSDKPFTPPQDVYELNNNAVHPYLVFIEPAMVDGEGFQFFKSVIESIGAIQNDAIVESSIGTDTIVKIINLI